MRNIRKSSKLFKEYFNGRKKFNILRILREFTFLKAEKASLEKEI